MKKLAMCLVVLTMAIPAMAADVDFAWDEATGTLSWTINKPDTEIVGMGLNVDCTEGTIATVAVDSFFDVFIDAAYSNPALYDGATSPAQAGTPVALQSVAGETTLPNAQFCVSVGHLEGVTDATGIVLTSDDSAVGVVSENATRGGVVDQNGDALTTNLPIDISFGPSEPECWSYSCFGNGDSNGDCVISYTDLQPLINAWAPKPYNACVDFNKDGVISYGDLQILINNWPPNGGCEESCVSVL